MLGLSACQQLDSTPNVGPCPVAGVLFDAERQVEIVGEELHENVAWTGAIEGVSGFCRYTDDNPITMEIEIDFAFGRGPMADGREKTFNYFVAVTRRDRVVLAKQITPITAKFDSDETVVRLTEEVGGIEIPRADIDGVRHQLRSAGRLRTDAGAAGVQSRRQALPVCRSGNNPAPDITRRSRQILTQDWG